MERQSCRIPGVEKSRTEADEVPQVACHERQAVLEGRGGENTSTTANAAPLRFRLAARRPQRSAMDSVTGRIRPANHRRTSRSSQRCRSLRFWLTGSMLMPLQISPMVITLRNTLSLPAFSRKAATRISGASRVSSDGTLVSTKYPFTIRYRAPGPCLDQNPD